MREEHIIALFDRIWGPFTCDASNINKKCKKFYSRFLCPGTSGVNAINYCWGQDNNWVVPPINLIGKSISRMETSKAKGVLVVPRWESAYYWPLICGEDGVFKEFVKDSLLYADCMNFFENSDNVSPAIRGSIMIVLKVDFSS